jgi:hypothetical protein
LLSVHFGFLFCSLERLLPKLLPRLSFERVPDFVADGLERIFVNRDEFEPIVVLNDVEPLAVLLS